MPKPPNSAGFTNNKALDRLGLSTDVIQGAVEYTYDILSAIDEKLVSQTAPRLAELLELANLSAVIGNLFREGVAKNSNGQFQANGPHKYPDLITTDPKLEDIEIKVALETNKPKGHLVKPGPHIIVRYVLGHPSGSYKPGKQNRGNTVFLWEVKVGYLERHHFNVSNTEGDSGKTAVINSAGMDALHHVFCDMQRCPYSPNGRIYKDLSSLFSPTGQLKLIANSIG